LPLSSSAVPRNSSNLVRSLADWAANLDTCIVWANAGMVRIAAFELKWVILTTIQL
jgi:hypothetical protein